MSDLTSFNSTFRSFQLSVSCSNSHVLCDGNGKWVPPERLKSDDLQHTPVLPSDLILLTGQRARGEEQNCECACVCGSRSTCGQQ